MMMWSDHPYFTLKPFMSTVCKRTTQFSNLMVLIHATVGDLKIEHLSTDELISVWLEKNTCVISNSLFKLLLFTKYFKHGRKRIM